MKRADFIHLVRLSEQASADDSQAYRRGVALFAALGYLWVVGCFVLALVLLIWTSVGIVQDGLKGIHWVLLGSGAGLLWTSLRALWLRLELPTGTSLTRTEAPGLFEALERIRKKIKGPPIHHVLLDSSFNTSICQIPRFGLMGGATNYLTIGLPLLMAIDRPRFLAVLSHEYGHLRGRHGQFAAWIYRTRLSWMKLEHSMRTDHSPLTLATQAFLRWYFPRFLAKTVALARQDEFEADRIAGKLVGRTTAGAALTEIAVKSDWLDAIFWPLHWSAAAATPNPIGPFGAMRKLLAQPAPDAFARASLRQALIALSDEGDTHPVLRDRLEALDVTKQLPTWSSHSALDLLGKGCTKWMAHFDAQWCSENAMDWTLHHDYLRRVQVAINTLTESIQRNSADEMTQLGDLQRRLNPSADVRTLYERALQITPDHAGALRGLADCLPESENSDRLKYLNQLFELSIAHRWWAARSAVQLLEKGLSMGSADYDQVLKVWRERFKEALLAEERAWAEMSETPFFHAIARHDLNEFEKGEFHAAMARCKPLVSAWLVRKMLNELPYRRCYLLFIELPGIPDAERYNLCRSLERSLDLPGRVQVLWAGHSPTLDDIRRNAFEAVYVRPTT